MKFYKDDLCINGNRDQKKALLTAGWSLTPGEVAEEKSEDKKSEKKKDK